MQKRKILIFINCLIITSCFSQDALVWGGKGACQDGCIEASYEMAKQAGLSAEIITRETYNLEKLKKAKIWIQPGGKSLSAAKDMGKDLLNDLRIFIANGGGYVGFCAGAFLSTKKIGSTGYPGLGIVPGRTKLFRYRKIRYPSSQYVYMNYDYDLPKSEGRYIYWEGGPYFIMNKEQRSQVKIRARYRKKNKIAAVENIFGQGRVSVTGLHPEAPMDWYTYGRILTKDGLDDDLAISMIKWAAKIN